MGSVLSIIHYWDLTKKFKTNEWEATLSSIKIAAWDILHNLLQSKLTCKGNTISPSSKF